MENRRISSTFFRWEKEIYGTDRKADNGQRTVSAYQKKIGRTTYNVAIHFSKTSRETMTDKINRLILHDINSEDFS